MVPAARGIGESIFGCDRGLADVGGHICAGIRRDADTLAPRVSLARGQDTPPVVLARHDPRQNLRRFESQKHTSTGLEDILLCRRMDKPDQIDDQIGGFHRADGEIVPLDRGDSVDRGGIRAIFGEVPRWRQIKSSNLGAELGGRAQSPVNKRRI